MKKADMANKLKTAINERTHESTDLPDMAEEIVQPDHERTRRNRKRRYVIEFPCAICGEECVERCVACDGCDEWHHYLCLGLTGEEEELKENTWYCEDCRV